VKKRTKWVRSSDSQDPIRISISISPERDPDLHQWASRLAFGEGPSAIRGILYAHLGIRPPERVESAQRQRREGEDSGSGEEVRATRLPGGPARLKLPSESAGTGSGQRAGSPEIRPAPAAQAMDQSTDDESLRALRDSLNQF